MEANPASEPLEFGHARRKDRLDIENIKNETPQPYAYYLLIRRKCKATCTENVGNLHQ